ncbi:MAG: 50S ribosomal protein L21 [Proteobacteria bacterium]|nr:50S ribosomal protein L21 [Pseudomonadota bacterium]
MYAVIKTGGKQYVVNEGDTIQVEKLTGEIGSTIDVGEVLAVGEGESVKVGTPIVEGASVTAEILDHDRDKKIIVFKKKRRKGYSRRQGHRQDYTSLKISQIKG